MTHSRLAHAEAGARLLVHHVDAAPSKIDKLAALGILPGVELHVLQRRPVVVVECGETTLALEHDLAAGVIVGALPAEPAADAAGGGPRRGK